MSNKVETISNEEYNKLLSKRSQSTTSNTNANSNNTNTPKNISLNTISANSLNVIDKISDKKLERNNNNNTLVDGVKQEAKERIGDLANKTKELGKKTTRKIKKAVGMKIDNKSDSTRKTTATNEPPKKSNILGTLFITLIFLAVLFAIYYYYKYYVVNSSKGLVLLKEPKDATNTVVISQNPTKKTNLFINKSFNKDGGIEFTYSFWMAIKNMDLVNKNKWKHIFHKGERDITNINSENEHTSLMSPGVFIHPSSNTLRIYLLVPSIELNKTLEYVDISNIPLRKWVNITFTFTQQKKSISSNKILHNSLDVYVNGLLKTRKLLSKAPKQFDKDLWINLNNGFDGLISNLKYYDSAIGSKEIYNIMRECPSETSCGLKADCPEYLSSNWWLN